MGAEKADDRNERKQADAFRRVQFHRDDALRRLCGLPRLKKGRSHPKKAEVSRQSSTHSQGLTNIFREVGGFRWP